MRAFDWCQNERAWMTLKGHYASCSKHVAKVLLFIYFQLLIQSAFSRQMCYIQSWEYNQVHVFARSER